MKGSCSSVVRFVQQSMGWKGNATIENPLPFSINLEYGDLLRVKLAG